MITLSDWSIPDVNGVSELTVYRNGTPIGTIRTCPNTGTYSASKPGYTTTCLTVEQGIQLLT